MPFNDTQLDVPEGMQTNEFRLRPIRATDAELDYDAVMESREFLRTWEQSSWPEDDFALEANREDLRKLEQRHAEHESFAFTVMNPDESRCLGCVYLFPLDASMLSRAEISGTDGSRWQDFSAAVYFWIRKSELADQLDRRLLAALVPWLDHDWGFDRPLFITNEQFEQQVAMIESAGLPLKFRINDPKAAGMFLGYGVSEMSS